MRASWDPRPPARSHAEATTSCSYEQFQHRTPPRLEPWRGRGSSGLRTRRSSSSSWRRRRSSAGAQLEQESGQELLELNGLLELVDELEGRARQTRSQAAGAEYEVLDAGRARERWPVGVPDGVDCAVPARGRASSAPTLRTARSSTGALAHGARLEERTRVDSLDDIDAKAVVVTAGPWIKSFFAGRCRSARPARRSRTSGAKAIRCRRSSTSIR